MNNHVINRPDKGAGVVILNKADYLSKMDAILGDTEKFLKLGDLSFDDTHRIENKQQKRYLELFKSKLMSKEIYEFICPVVSQRPRMYGLPKIHNSGIPLRPILSMCHSAQHSLAKWLVEVLNPVLEFYSGCCVKYSFTFSSTIRRLLVCMESQFLVSFDVSLFTSIPLDETISICADFCITVHLLPLFPFLRMFSLNWWALPQSQCLLVLMRPCSARLRALVWDLPMAPFWRIFLLGSMKDSVW